MKIGLFGGTFDPPHIGHIIAARIAMEEMELDQVIFVPAGVPPHKMDKNISATHHRLEMVRAAVVDEAGFDVSDWELRQKGPSYTVDTLRWFAAEHSDSELFFIVGADMLCDLPKWHESTEILRLAHVIGVTRPGTDIEKCQVTLSELPEMSRDRVHVVHMIGLDVSSTWIRERLSSASSVRHLVPQPVIEYIKEHSLYE